MQKPTFPTIVIFTGPEIKAIRSEYRMTQKEFARFFPVSVDCIRSWELGRSRPFGPSGVRLQELKAWADWHREEKEKAYNSILKKNKIIP